MSVQKKTSPLDYLAVVGTLSKQLNSLSHTREQIRAYCEVIREICPRLEKIYIAFFHEKETVPEEIFSFDKKSGAVTARQWGKLSGKEKILFDDFQKQRTQANKGKQKKQALKKGAKKKSGTHLNLLAVIPMQSSSGPEGWVLLAGKPYEGDLWGEKDQKAASVCTDMLSAGLDRAWLFEKVLHAKREWERSVDAIRDVVMIIGPDFTVLRGNRQLAERAGIPLKALRGKKCYRLLYSSKSPCRACPADVTRQTKEEATAEVPGTRNDTVFQVWSYPILGPSGTIDSMSVYEKDITEYKLMQQKLVHAEKMAVLGQLSAAVAHELNNPLSGVISFSKILLGEMDPTLPYIEDIKNIEHAALRCKQIIKDLLAFARKPEPMAYEPVSLCEVAQQVSELMQRQLEEKDIRLEINISSKLPEISLHPDPLHQILMNLITNARDAMAPGGRVKLSAKQETRKGSAYLRLSVQDTGPGISSHDLEKIFEPFYTTKGPGEGTGLGLSICQKARRSLMICLHLRAACSIFFMSSI